MIYNLPQYSRNRKRQRKFDLKISETSAQREERLTANCKRHRVARFRIVFETGETFDVRVHQIAMFFICYQRESVNETHQEETEGESQARQNYNKLRSSKAWILSQDYVESQNRVVILLI